MKLSAKLKKICTVESEPPLKNHRFKVVLRPKKNFVFPLDFKTMLTKH